MRGHRHFLRLLQLIAPACALAAPAAHAIVGGSDDGGDDAVVSIQVGGFPSCTGTLIGARTVLTAGHCLVDVGGIPLVVVEGQDATKNDAPTFDVVDSARHPQYTGEGKDFDVALFKLDRDAGIPPIALVDHVLTDADVGRNLRHVGYGVSNESDGSGRGVRRTVDMLVTQVTPTLVFSGSTTQQTCDGDSGGPGLLIDDDGVEKVASITSDGPDCHSIGWDSRVDASRGFIEHTRDRFEQAAQKTPAPSGCACAHGSASAAFLLLGFALRMRRRSR